VAADGVLRRYWRWFGGGDWEGDVTWEWIWAPSLSFRQVGGGFLKGGGGGLGDILGFVWSGQRFGGLGRGEVLSVLAKVQESVAILAIQSRDVPAHEFEAVDIEGFGKSGVVFWIPRLA